MPSTKKSPAKTGGVHISLMVGRFPARAGADSSPVIPETAGASSDARQKDRIYAVTGPRNSWERWLGRPGVHRTSLPMPRSEMLPLSPTTTVRTAPSPISVSTNDRANSGCRFRTRPLVWNLAVFGRRHPPPTYPPADLSLLVCDTPALHDGQHRFAIYPATATSGTPRWLVDSSSGASTALLLPL